MLLIAYGGQFAVKRVRSLNRYAPLLQRLFGVIILLVAAGLATKLDLVILSYLLEHAPWLFVSRYIKL